MEAMLKKFQQKYRRIRDEMKQWDELQSQFLRKLDNASSIIERLQVLGDTKRYGGLTQVCGITNVMLGKQMESLNHIFGSMKETVNEFHGIVMSLEKILRDGNQLLKGGSMQPTIHQMQMRVGIKPSLSQCLDGLRSLHEMHRSEYLLKLSALSSLTLISSASDLGVLKQLIFDQPNIPKDEVEFIFNIIFPEEIC